MIGQLTNHLWQSTLFALAAALLTLAFRRNRAEVRYCLWLVASLKFLVPFSVLISIGSQLQWTPAAQRIAARAPSEDVLFTFERFAEPFDFGAPAAHHIPQPHTDWKLRAIAGMWLCGLVSIVCLRCRAWRRIRAAAMRSKPLDLSVAVETRLSSSMLEPGVVGIWRPVLLLPDGIVERLSRSELDAVIAHELCHVRRRDNLIASIHMLVEALFWFHPLVWWIGARLLEERERACDEHVLSLGNQPDVYADAILNVCKLYTESPLVCVSGVSGADLRRRIEAIMSNQRVRGLNLGKKSLLLFASIAAVLGPVSTGVVIGIGHVPRVLAQGPPPRPVVPQPVLVAQEQTVPTRNAAAVQSGQTPAEAIRPQPSTVSRFEVVSIKPCKADSRPGSGRGGGASGTSPAILRENCATVSDLIRQAYVEYVSGRGSAFPQLVPIQGGPNWINSERYEIDAKAEGAPGQAILRGPMLQALLQERFHLNVHRETRDVPVYALTVAKGGIKLEPTKEGSCVPWASTPAAPGVQFCGQPKRGDQGLHLIGATMTDLCKILSVPEISDRPTIDKTGITGRFDISLPAIGELRGGASTATDPAAPVAVDDSSPFEGMRMAVQKFGLNLERAKGGGALLVIDHVERPSEN